MDTTWESLPVTEDPSPYRHATRSSFLRVMFAFKDFYRARGDHESIKKIVKSRAGDRLQLGIPYNLFVELTPKDLYPELKDINLSHIVCCDEPLTVLGRLVIRNHDGNFKNIGAALCIGARGRIYVYEISEDAAILVSPDLDKMARFGFIYCETLYRSDIMPQCTMTPNKVVAGLLMCGNDMNKISEFCTEHFGIDVVMYTPGFKFQPMKLVSGFNDITWYWPFNAMDPNEVQCYHDGITTRLCCQWKVFAIVGSYAPVSYYNVGYVMIVDTFGCIYAVDVMRQKLYRMADNMSMLFRMGLCKAIAFGARFDRNDKNAKRCESEPICPHSVREERDSDKETCEMEFRWLCRTGRFRADMRTWDYEDKEAMLNMIRNNNENDDDENDSDNEESDDYPRPDDGTRTHVWHEERAWGRSPRLEQGEGKMLARYMTENTVTIAEVEARRIQERERNEHNPSLCVILPALLLQ